MLDLPEMGFHPSIKTHNCRLDVLTDWIEGSVIFSEKTLSQSDIVDVLHGNNIYRDQNFAIAFLVDAWDELERRQNSFGGSSPFKVQGRRIRRTRDWSTVPAHSFCMLLSLQAWYQGWAQTQFGHDYTAQGDLFERLTAASLDAQGWTTLRTGWNPNIPNRIRNVVADVASHLFEAEVVGAIDKWIADEANDEGLDVVASRPFPDCRGGRPLVFFQCASGARWASKLHTPDPETWRKIISFTTVPQRGFALPFALLTDEFRKKSGKVNGLMLDRPRLLTPSFNGDNAWLPRPLSRDILAWLRPRVRALPKT